MNMDGCGFAEKVSDALLSERGVFNKTKSTLKKKLFKVIENQVYV